MSGWILGNMVLASAAMLVVLLLRRPAAAVFGGAVAYSLWLLPAFRLVQPPQSWFGADLPSIAAPLELLMPSAGAMQSPAAEGWSIPWVAILLVAWAAGAAVFLGWQWLAYRAFLTRLSFSSRTAGAYGGLPLVESAAVEGPVAVGLLDRRIVIPADFELRYAEEERRLALEHEFIHHRRGDIWFNLAALAILAVNWFNPLAWIAFRAFRADQELACDAAVAAAASAPERHHYARALVKSASRPGLIAACPLNHADQLKRRLKMIDRHSINRTRSFAGAAGILVLAGLGASFGAPGFAHPHPEGEQKERRIMILETKNGERPAGSHAFRIERGEDGEIVLPRGCDAGEQLVNVDEGNGEQRTRVVLCSPGEASAADRLERLQQTRERIASHDMLGDHRDDVLAAIDREIARLQGN